MKKNIFLCTIIFFISQIIITAQNQLPPLVKNAIPDKYKITSELYHKADFIVNVDIGLEIPSKYGCDEDLKDPCNIRIGVYSVGREDIAKMQEDIMPFSQYLPTKESHKPEIDTWDELIKYSETKIVDMPGGRGAYYTWTRKCIQAQYDEYYGVSFTGVFGNHSTRIVIEVNGNIDASEAISIAKELHEKINKINFQDL